MHVSKCCTSSIRKLYLMTSLQEMEMTDGVMGSQDVWGEPVERCMHCFMDFPLSVLVEHSRRCMGDLSGPRERLKGFLPSIHDVS